MKKFFLKFKEMSKGKKIILCFTVIIIILLMLGVCAIVYKPEAVKEITKKLETKKEVEEVKKITIFNTESKTRPIAVMINNHNQARPYHSGLDKAQIVYEFIVEGGITRMLAVFKDQDVSRIGPVRSSRHYYLDYAMENDAIYVHWGWSPQAESDIKTLGINNLNGLYDYGFSRDQSLVGKINLEHTAITSTDGINESIKRKGYRSEYKVDNVEDALVLKYSADEINLGPEEQKEESYEESDSVSVNATSFASLTNAVDESIPKEENDSIVAKKIVVPYSNYMTASYIYDDANKYYLRYANGAVHKDYITGEQYHFKNILILKVENHTMDSYGRQDLKNVGTGKGYYITNGYAREITWQKDSRSSKTIYKYKDGSDVIVNDGNTFIQVEPINMNPSISE